MMNRTTLLFSIAILALLGTSCNRENETSWDTAVLAPLAEGRLGVNDLIPDSFITSAAGAPLYLRIEFTEDLIEKDSLLRIPDTVITDAISLPVNLTLPSGFEVADISQLIRFNYRDVMLTEAFLEEGFAELNIQNNLDDKIFFEYSIPKATINGQSLQVNGIQVEAESSYQLLTNLSGYKLDLRGDNLIQANRLRFLINALLNPNGNGSPVYANQAFVTYSNKFFGIKPYFARGYLGQTSFSFTGGANLSFMKQISGLIELEDITLTIDIENSVGADFVVQLNSISGSRESNSISLSHEIIGNELSFARAQLIPFESNPYTPYNRSVVFSSSNSNLKEFIEFLPHRIEYNVDSRINPLGNVSSGNDFVFSSSNIKLKSVLELPLKFRAENLSFRDTIAFEGLKTEDLANVGDGELRLLAMNGFPMNMKIELSWLDEQKNLLGTSLIDQTIAAAPVDASLKVTNSQKTVLNIPFNQKLKNDLESCRFIGLRAVFDTKPDDQLLPVYAGYELKLQLIGDGIYTIKTK